MKAEEGQRSSELEGPIEFYQVYGALWVTVDRFPWRLLLHITMVVLGTVQVVSLVNSSLTQARSEFRYFYFWLLDIEAKEFQKGEDYSRFTRVFDIDSLKETLNTGLTVFASSRDRTTMMQKLTR